MVTLTNVGSSYDAIAASKGLGMQRINFTGIASVVFEVFVNKVGTGTQSWQLWNVTDSSEIAVIDDAGGAGDKTLSVTQAVSLSGEKIVRVRAKSSLSTDDPVFYGASVLTRA